MQITESVKESYEWAYEFAKAGYEPIINVVETDEQFAYLVGYLDGFFGDENDPEILKKLPRTHKS